MIVPCPGCYPRGFSNDTEQLPSSWEPQSTTIIEVYEPTEPLITMAEAMEHPEGFENGTTECIKYDRCGHVFERESMEPVLKAIDERRSIRRELKRTEDWREIKDIKEYKLPAANNKIRNKLINIDRRRDLEDDELSGRGDAVDE